MSKGNLLSIKNRIKSAQSIFSLAKSLELVSSSKFRSLKKKQEANLKMKEVAKDFFNKIPFITKGEDVAIVVGSDNSLCGGFNNSVFKASSAFSAPIVLGKKLQKMYTAKNIAHKTKLDIDDLFVKLLNGKVGSVVMIYNTYSESKIKLIKELILPLEFEINEYEQEYDFKSSLRLYLSMVIDVNLNLSGIAENYSRMVAMKNASDNSEELVSSLSKKYNKGRQYLITKDMMEIAGGLDE